MRNAVSGVVIARGEEELKVGSKLVDAILFDKDGTLVDFNKTWFMSARELAIQRAGEMLGKEAGEKEIEATAMTLLEQGGWDEERKIFRSGSTIAAGTTMDIVRLWNPEVRGDEERLLQLEAAYNVHFTKAGAKYAVPLQGLHATLKALDVAAFKMGINTSDSAESATATATELQIADHFDVIIGYNTVAHPKPAADSVNHFSARTGVPNKHIAMVGDNPHDILTAHNAEAGLAVGVLSGNSGDLELFREGPNAVLHSVASLPRFFARNNPVLRSFQKCLLTNQLEKANTAISDEWLCQNREVLRELSDTLAVSTRTNLRCRTLRFRAATVASEIYVYVDTQLSALGRMRKNGVLKEMFDKFLKVERHHFDEDQIELLKRALKFALALADLSKRALKGDRAVGNCSTESNAESFESFERDFEELRTCL